MSQVSSTGDGAALIDPIGASPIASFSAADGLVGEAAVLCRRWHDRHDISAADRLARSHRHLVVDIARQYSPGGQPSPHLIAEGQLGLMRAICRFDPDTGARFAAYAASCVRAAIHDSARRSTRGKTL